MEKLLILMVIMLLIHLNKAKIKGQTGDGNNDTIAGTVDIKIMGSLKYLIHFWRTLEMPLINCEIELILDWSANCVIIYTDDNNQIPTFTITEINLYVSVVTSSTQDNSKLLPQLKNGFKRAITWNIYLIKPELLPQNSNLNRLIEPSFQEVNRLFIQPFEKMIKEQVIKDTIFQM